MDGSIPKPRSSEMAVSERGGHHWNQGSCLEGWTRSPSYLVGMQYDQIVKKVHG